MKHNKWYVLMVALTLFALALTACGGSSSSGFPTGKFVDANNSEGGFIFNEDGTWESYNGIYTLAKGTYSATNDTYTEETSNSECPAMSFKYTFDGENLTFQLTEEAQADPCSGRKDAFDNRTYILTK
jgi:hypothetical protein